MVACDDCADTLGDTTTGHRQAVGGVTYTTEIVADLCSVCRKVTLDPASGQNADERIARHIAEHGPMTGEGLRFMRIAMGLHAAGLGEMVAQSAAMLTRWESNKAPIDRAAWLIVGSLVLEREVGVPRMADRIAALIKPKKRLRVKL
jgi:DNA-binding transcriptional regulator YiaG